MVADVVVELGEAHPRQSGKTILTVYRWNAVLIDYVAAVVVSGHSENADQFQAWDKLVPKGSVIDQRVGDKTYCPCFIDGTGLCRSCPAYHQRYVGVGYHLELLAVGVIHIS